MKPQAVPFEYIILLIAIPVMYFEYFIFLMANPATSFQFLLLLMAIPGRSFEYILLLIDISGTSFKCIMLSLHRDKRSRDISHACQTCLDWLILSLLMDTISGDITTHICLALFLTG